MNGKEFSPTKLFKLMCCSSHGSVCHLTFGTYGILPSTAGYGLRYSVCACTFSQVEPNTIVDYGCLFGIRGSENCVLRKKAVFDLALNAFPRHIMGVNKVCIG